MSRSRIRSYLLPQFAYVPPDTTDADARDSFIAFRGDHVMRAMREAGGDDALVSSEEVEHVLKEAVVLMLSSNATYVPLPDGTIEYRFPKSRLSLKHRLERAEARSFLSAKVRWVWRDTVFPLLYFLIRNFIAFFLLFSILICILALIALLAAGSSRGGARGGESHRQRAPLLMFRLNRFFLHDLFFFRRLFVFWPPALGAAGVMAARRNDPLDDQGAHHHHGDLPLPVNNHQARGEAEGMEATVIWFVDAVMNFIFGEGPLGNNPTNEELELATLKWSIAHHSQFVVEKPAITVLPYLLDAPQYSPPHDLVVELRYMSKILFRFDGDARSSPDGQRFTYSFERNRGLSARERPPDGPLGELVKASLARGYLEERTMPPVSIGAGAYLGIANVALLIIMQMKLWSLNLYENAETDEDFAARTGRVGMSALRLVAWTMPVLAVYAFLYLAIPTARHVYITWNNSLVNARNEVRKALATSPGQIRGRRGENVDITV